MLQKKLLFFILIIVPLSFLFSEQKVADNSKNYEKTSEKKSEKDSADVKGNSPDESINNDENIDDQKNFLKIQKMLSNMKTVVIVGATFFVANCLLLVFLLILLLKSNQNLENFFISNQNLEKHFIKIQNNNTEESTQEAKKIIDIHKMVQIIYQSQSQATNQNKSQCTKSQNNYNGKFVEDKMENFSFNIISKIEEMDIKIDKLKTIISNTPHSMRTKTYEEAYVMVESKPDLFAGNTKTPVWTKYGKPDLENGGFVVFNTPSDGVAYFIFEGISDGSAFFNLYTVGKNDLISGSKNFSSNIHDYFDLVGDNVEPTKEIIDKESGLSELSGNRWIVKKKGKISYV